MSILVTVETVVRDEGSIVILGGTTDDGQYLTFAADHRPAYAIAQALDEGEEPRVELEPWQILSQEVAQ